MDQNILIGAGIAIISTSLGTILSYFLKTLEIDRKRKWELEDQINEKKQKLLLERINQIESLVFEVFNCANKTLEQIVEMSLSTQKIRILTAILSNLRIKIKSLSLISDVLEDDLLSTNISDFAEVVDSLIQLLKKIPIEGGEIVISPDDFTNGLFNSLDSLDKPSQRVLGSLERLRIEVMNSQI